jgi:hypothetical protein
LGMSSGMGTPFYMAPEMLTTPVQVIWVFLLSTFSFFFFLLLV